MHYIHTQNIYAVSYKGYLRSHLPMEGVLCMPRESICRMQVLFTVIAAAACASAAASAATSVAVAAAAVSPSSDVVVSALPSAVPFAATSSSSASTFGNSKERIRH